MDHKLVNIQKSNNVKEVYSVQGEIFNRPGVAGAVLETASSFIH